MRSFVYGFGVLKLQPACLMQHSGFISQLAGALYIYYRSFGFKFNLCYIFQLIVSLLLKSCMHYLVIHKNTHLYKTVIFSFCFQTSGTQSRQHIGLSLCVVISKSVVLLWRPLHCLLAIGKFPIVIVYFCLFIWRLGRHIACTPSTGRRFVKEMFGEITRALTFGNDGDVIF